MTAVGMPKADVLPIAASRTKGTCSCSAALVAMPVTATGYTRQMIERLQLARKSR